MDDTIGESEKRFRSVFFDVGAGHVLVAPDGRIELVNKAYCTLMGYSEAELRGLDPDTITYPDDRVVGAWEFARLLAGETPYVQVEKRFVRKDGRILWGLVSSSAIFDDHGQLLSVFSHVQDVTARREAEEELREQTQIHDALLRALSDLDQIIILSEAGAPIYMNDGLARITGYQPEEIRRIGSLYDLVPVDQRSALVEMVQRSAGSGKPIRFDASVVRKDGGIIDLEVTSLQFQTGGHTRTFTLARENTSRKQLKRPAKRGSRA